MFLECLDRAAAEAGLTRSTVTDVKSSVRLVGAETALPAFEEELEENWVTNRVRKTCKILESNSRVEVLGTVIGTMAERNQFFDERLTKPMELSV